MKKKKSLSADDFFKKISERANYLNEEVVREVFYEMVRVAVFELRTKKVIKLPDFGEFRIILHKERNSRDLRSREIRHVPAHHTVKFSPDYKLKHFFKMFGGDDVKMGDVNAPKGGESSNFDKIQ